MRKVYIMENLGCANCAAKMEDKFNACPEVEAAQIVFATRQLRLTAEEPDILIPMLQALARTVESGIVIRPADESGAATQSGHEHGEGCGCGHDHGHGRHEDRGATEAKGIRHWLADEKAQLLLGGCLFGAGLALDAAGAEIPALAVCLAAWVLLGREVVGHALKNLIRGHVFDENFLMSVATVGAFLIGEAPEAVGVMFFYRIGEFFEHRAVERSRKQIMEAVDLRTETVNLLVRGKVRVTPAGRVLPGAQVLVRPGDRIPLDGTVVSGTSRIDTAPITGEPVPVAVGPGDAVVSGCLNGSGQLTVKVEKPLSESMVTRILNSVENAAAGKPRIQRFLTRFARIYTPAVVAVAAAVAVIPSVVTGNWSYWVYTALTFLVMSCPCALVLSVPLAFFAGIGVGSRKGILFKGGQSMEALAKVKAVVMDKTGTLTRGEFTVQASAGGEEMLALAASAESGSNHPIAASIAAAAKQKGLAVSRPEELEEFPGEGIRAMVEGHRILCGNAALLERFGIGAGDLPEDTGEHTRVLVAKDGRFMGWLALGDALKPGAAQAVEQLKARGLATAILTGDNEASARAVARRAGVEQVFAQLLPHEKLERLQAIRQEKGAVLFVGDGINDAPVLAGADVGAAMGSGADAAIEAADLVFMTSDPGAIGQALEISGQTMAVAKQNVVFALGIKLAVMALGLLGGASMWLAVFADSGVAMLCVLNSVRMLYRKR